MIKVRNDLTNLTFGRLTVLEQTNDYVSPNGMHYSMWVCRCECGNVINVLGSNLKTGHTKSCGCYGKEKTSKLSKKYNKYSEKMVDEYGEYYIGWTTNTNKEFYVDAEYFNKIYNYCWHEGKPTKNKKFSTLVTNEPKTRKHIKMHILLGFNFYDHIDKNELNNRKYNLRPCTQQENIRNSSLKSNNTSGITGVSFDKNNNKWIAYIDIVKNKSTYLGRFKNKEDAIKARLQAEMKYYKEFAPQRHLFEQYGINTQQNDLNKEIDD